jgi:erythromycin esterase
MIGDARIVALGEATHGTHEFFTMKHRILECLVTEKGFSMFAMEAGWGEANRINAYVNGGPHPDNISLLGGSEIWDLIAWMRQYNGQSSNTRKLSFRGFDMQWGDLIVDDLLAYVNAVDPGRVGVVEEDLNCFLTHVNNYSADLYAPLYSQAGEEIQSECRQGLQSIYALFQEHQPTYELASSPAEFAEACYLVTLLLQNDQLMAAATSDMASFYESFNVRDRFMADNISWLLDHADPEARMVVWAHNGHVTPAGWRWTWTDDAGHQTDAGPMIPMGMHLRNTYEDDLVVIGFGFATGSFDAIGSSITGTSLGYGVYSIESPLSNGHETYLLTANLPRFILDLRPMQIDPLLADWFHEPRWLTSFGMGYVVGNPTANADLVVLPDKFDILIFFEKTTAQNR